MIIAKEDLTRGGLVPIQPLSKLSDCIGEGGLE